MFRTLFIFGLFLFSYAYYKQTEEWGDEIWARKRNQPHWFRTFERTSYGHIKESIQYATQLGYPGTGRWDYVSAVVELPEYHDLRFSHGIFANTSLREMNFRIHGFISSDEDLQRYEEMESRFNGSWIKQDYGTLNLFISRFCPGSSKECDDVQFVRIEYKSYFFKEDISRAFEALHKFHNVTINSRFWGIVKFDEFEKKVLKIVDGSILWKDCKRCLH